MFRPVIEFFTDGVAQLAQSVLAASHLHEAVARTRAASPCEVEAAKTKEFLPEVDLPDFRFIQRQTLGLHMLFQSLHHRATAAGATQQLEVISVVDGLRPGTPGRRLPRDPSFSDTKQACLGLKGWCRRL